MRKMMPAEFKFPLYKCFMVAPLLGVYFPRLSTSAAYVLSFFIFYSSASRIPSTKETKAHLFKSMPFKLSPRSYDRCLHQLKKEGLLKFVPGETGNHSGHYELSPALAIYKAASEGFTMKWAPLKKKLQTSVRAA